ncbi:hypothetical protein WA158_003893 [Blastocystis sp. Blastoise]
MPSDLGHEEDNYGFILPFSSSMSTKSTSTKTIKRIEMISILVLWEMFVFSICKLFLNKYLNYIDFTVLSIEWSINIMASSLVLNNTYLSTEIKMIISSTLMISISFAILSFLVTSTFIASIRVSSISAILFLILIVLLYIMLSPSVQKYINIYLCPDSILSQNIQDYSEEIQSLDTHSHGECIPTCHKMLLNEYIDLFSPLFIQKYVLQKWTCNRGYSEILTLYDGHILKSKCSNLLSISPYMANNTELYDRYIEHNKLYTKNILSADNNTIRYAWFTVTCSSKQYLQYNPAIIDSSLSPFQQLSTSSQLLPSARASGKHASLLSHQYHIQLLFLPYITRHQFIIDFPKTFQYLQNNIALHPHIYSKNNGKKQENNQLNQNNIFMKYFGIGTKMGFPTVYDGTIAHCFSQSPCINSIYPFSYTLQYLKTVTDPLYKHNKDIDISLSEDDAEDDIPKDTTLRHRQTMRMNKMHNKNKQKNYYFSTAFLSTEKNLVTSLDDALYRYILNITQSPDTILFLTGIYGQEHITTSDRLTPLYVITPPSLPLYLYTNLYNNQNRIVTYLDFYTSLHHVTHIDSPVTLSEKKHNQWTNSIFEPMKLKRCCQDIKQYINVKCDCQIIN